MCGLAGIIFGERERSTDEVQHLTQLFTRLLVISRQRGPHATGVAWINRDGAHRLLKRPMPAEQFVEHKAFPQLLAGVDSRTTLLLGHTRWRTRGDEHVNRNNHPIRAGEVVGIHNGTIYNADELFDRYRLTRYAHVDSEILFRIAAATLTRRGRIDVRRLKARLRQCRGQIAAVMVSRRDPQTVLVIKGNNPLELRWNPYMRAVLYASSASYLNKILIRESGWRELVTDPMTLLIMRRERLDVPLHLAVDFVATPTDWNGLYGFRQSRFDEF
jgi:glucosamine 6-phosphate synthetase-like amidotransferase/phosphosugar isomerase protein